MKLTSLRRKAKNHKKELREELKKDFITGAQIYTPIAAVNGGRLYLSAKTKDVGQDSFIGFWDKSETAKFWKKENKTVSYGIFPARGTKYQAANPFDLNTLVYMKQKSPALEVNVGTPKFFNSTIKSGPFSIGS